MNQIFLVQKKINLQHENLLGIINEDQEEDDLEIPAFLRRQKN